MERKIKSFCYQPKCGPVVRTGFNIEQYWICRECKSEITERLKEDIENKLKPAERKKDDGDDDGFDGMPW